MKPNHIGAIAIAVLPILYNIAMHKAGLHGADFDPKWLLGFWGFAGGVAFWKEIRAFMNDREISFLGFKMGDKK